MADYAISNVPRRVVYANSGVGPYAFTFEILSQTDIAVYRGSTLLTLTTDYSVTINTNGTGSVTLVTAGTGNITIVGAKNIQRTTDFTTGGDLFANSLNDELDNLTIFVQQVAETAERGLKAPVVDPTDIAMTLPAKDDRKGKVLAFDSTTGNPVSGPALDSVTTVIEQSANINTVADNIASVNTVAGNTTNINTVAGVSSNVTTVAGSISNVNTVASDLNEPVSEINTVAVNINNVNEVGNYINNVNAVAANTSNINSVAGNSTNINAVAGNATNINAVATNSTNINTVATNIANVNNVGNNIANVNQVAADTVVINSASANATAAANSANAAASSATSAATSAAQASAVALGNEPVRHSVRPSLLLDFANTKTLDPRITFTRGSTGTFYDGRTVAKAEENLLIRSQEFDNVIWSKQGGGVALAPVLTANHATAPDGTTTAERLQLSLNSGTATADLSWLSQTVTVPSGFDTTFSVWLRSTDGVSSYTVQLISPTNAGTAITVTGTWTRFTVTAASAGAVAYGVRLRGGQSPTNSNTADMLIWGAQLEQRSSVTAYTATTTAPITNYIPALQTAAANTARFEHNPVTGESLGLEIEEQRTNLLTYSDDFANSSGWVRTNANLESNVAVAPDGTLIADKLVETTASGLHKTDRATSVTAANSTAHTYSVYVKAAGRSWIALQFTGGFSANHGAYFDLTNGVVGNLLNSPTATSITPVGNGWYRCSITATTTSTSIAIATYIASANGTVSYAGDGFSGIYIWGAQLEAGSFATSYIPTVASQVTRSRDDAVMTGTNFSSWYRADEGSIYAEHFSNDTANFPTALYINGAGSNQLYTDTRANTVRAITAVNGTNVLVRTATKLATNKVAIVYKANSHNVSFNGAATSSDASGGVPQNMTSMTIGAAFGGGSSHNGTIKKIAYYPLRLTNSELQSLSTI